jgi:hypothetical protein
MKLKLVLLVGVFTLMFSGVSYAEQKIIFDIERIASQKDSSNCKERCEEKFPPNTFKELMDSGWKITSVFPKEEVIFPFTTFLNLVQGCSCFGSQYLMEKETKKKRKG